MASKWQLHRLYAKHPGLRKYLPPTGILSPAVLAQYMGKYRTVYIKGMNQHTGIGIVKAWRSEGGYRYIRVRGKPVYVKSIRDLYYKSRDGRPGRSILVQKAVDLAVINGRPFDIRVMLMRGGKGTWQYAGMLAKVAGKGSVISNVNRGGGYATTVDHALAKSLGYGQERIARVKRELIRVSFEIIRYSTRSGYGSFQTGIDLAIDRHGRIWLIEANLNNPSHGLFNRLTDKTFYRKIKGLAAAYKKHRPR